MHIAHRPNKNNNKSSNNKAALFHKHNVNERFAGNIFNGQPEIEGVKISLCFFGNEVIRLGVHASKGILCFKTVKC